MCVVELPRNSSSSTKKWEGNIKTMLRAWQQTGMGNGKRGGGVEEQMGDRHDHDVISVGRKAAGTSEF